jgi:hypothetical protein
MAAIDALIYGPLFDDAALDYVTTKEEFRNGHPFEYLAVLAACSFGADKYEDLISFALARSGWSDEKQTIALTSVTGRRA